MAYEIIGETIKSATSIKLGKLFGTDIYRYKESITNMKYPNFFISQLNLQVNSAGRNRVKLDYFMNIKYRVASDIQNVSNLQQELDEIGLKLTTNLLSLDLEKPTKTKNRYYTKDENGVLQFFFNVTVFAIPDEKEKTTPQQKLSLNKEVI